MKKMILAIISILALSACSAENESSIKNLVMPHDNSQYTSDLSLDLVIEDINNPPKNPPIPKFVLDALKGAGVLSSVNHTYTVGDIAIDANINLLSDVNSQISILKEGLKSDQPKGLKVSGIEGIGDFATRSEISSSFSTTNSIVFIQGNYMVTLTSVGESATLQNIATDYSAWLSQKL